MKGCGAEENPRGGKRSFSRRMNPKVFRNFDTCFPITEGRCWEKRFRCSNPRRRNKTKGQGGGGRGVAGGGGGRRIVRCGLISRRANKASERCESLWSMPGLDFTSLYSWSTGFYFFFFFICDCTDSVESKEIKSVSFWFLAAII